jgi:endonuclease/exonuclease/phosphatase family metal-dependent hydrolase
VVLFQEVTTTFAREFDRQMKDTYPFYVTAGTGPDHFGSGTWSRLPLGEVVPIKPSPRGNTMHRVLLYAGGAPIWLYNVHLANPTGENREDGQLAMLRRFDGTFRNAELDWLIDQTADLDGPYILAGDFNSAAGSEPYRRFPPSWHDAYAQAGRGFGHTFPSPAHEDPSSWLWPFEPFVRIDYVLTSPTILPVRAWTRPLEVSDHLTVIADLALPAPVP